jgi:ABC-2 type transport system permease protein
VIVLVLTAQPSAGVDWGGTFGVLAGLYLMCVTYGAMGLFASSLTKNQVVALIVGMIFCTFLFMMSSLYTMFPGSLGRLADFIGVMSHLETLGRGVWDFRDLFYFFSVVFLFLYFTVQRLATRRF